ncbi:TetR/AcrR family transcriptional regulator [Actinomyces mediterranea]|uniref:TetR/AcrR family transcriptional regulator n=1 Tax=Actinomyces mediterranea TaxID=1871028 RepID=UPI000970DC22|nr:TetR/AcrR family transcriptional regulator [Actinomyces mediterranea]
MARTKKDPNVRRSKFVSAAASLFFSNGYERTSVRDILDAVGDKTASPSVFYYYFSSKADLYQVVMQEYASRYLAQVDACMVQHADNPEQMMVEVLKLFARTLSQDKHTDEALTDPANRLMLLDLRAVVAERFVALWRAYINQLDWLDTDDETKEGLALFITGGIGEMVYEFSTSSRVRKDDDGARLIEHIIDFAADALHAPDAVREEFRRHIKGDSR